MALNDIIDKLKDCFDDDDNYVDAHISLLLKSPSVLSLITTVCSFITKTEVSLLGVPTLTDPTHPVMNDETPALTNETTLLPSETSLTFNESSIADEPSNLNEPKAPVSITNITRTLTRRKLNEAHESAKEVAGGKAC
mgnify:FL=1